MNRVFLIVFFLLCYLYISTGLHSDDYIFLKELEGKSFSDILTLIFTTPLYLKNSIIILYDFLQFHFFEWNHLYYDLVKVVTSFACFYVAYIFLKDYMKEQNALLSAFVFLLFPIHDATNYWVVGQYLLITLSFVMLGHYFINNEKYTKGVVFSFLGSFASYSSLPFSFGLSVLFLVKKEYKKFLIFIIPQLIYIVYFFVVSKIFKAQAIKGSSDFNIFTLIKQYILQAGTFIDASIGPSLWLKVYYSLFSLSFTSIVIGVVLSTLFYRFYKIEKEIINRALLIALVMVTLFAFGIFALTGMYPQIAFNLGNRITIYGSLLVAFLIVVLISNNKKIATIVFSIFIFAALGISDHWKDWNTNQLQIIKNISNNKELKEFDTNEQLFVSYNQYSKMGELSHIEFFAQGMAKHIFEAALNKTYKVSTLNRRFIYKGDHLFDRKFNKKVYIKDIVYIYDSKNDKLLKIKKENINSYIDMLPKDNRHWLQLFDKDSFLMKLVLKLMPRLEYAL